MGRTLDQKSGQLLTLSGKPGTLWPSLTPAILQKMYLAGYPKDADSECVDAVKGNDAPDDSGFELFLTRGGLTLAPTFLPHVVAACGEEVTVPYSALRRYANAGSPYFKDLYR